MIREPDIDAADDAWLVYADALQEVNDPRGELITLNHHVARNPEREDARNAHVKKHAVELFGGAAAHLERCHITWRHCWVDEIEIHLTNAVEGKAVVSLFLKAPASKHVRSFRLVGEGSVDLRGAMSALETHRPASCRSFAFVDGRASRSLFLVSRDYEPERNLVSFGSFSPFFAVAERIEIEVADGGALELGDIDAPDVRAFVLRCLRWTEELSQTLARASMPKVVDLELRLTETFTANVPLRNDVYEDPYDDMEDDRDDEADAGESYQAPDWGLLAGLFSKLSGREMQRLALTDVHFIEALLEVVRNAGFPVPLGELDLSGCNAGPAIEWILANEKALSGTKRLVLRDVVLPPQIRGVGSDLKQLVAALEKIIPEVEITERARAHHAGALHRFIVGME